jgi:hypothetical protein
VIATCGVFLRFLPSAYLACVPVSLNQDVHGAGECNAAGQEPQVGADGGVENELAAEH